MMAVGDGTIAAVTMTAKRKRALKKNYNIGRRTG